MNIVNIVKQDQVDARKGGRKNDATSLTTLLSEIVTVGKNQNRETTDSEAIAVIKKFIKNNDDYIALKPEKDVITGLLAENALFQKYIPQQLSEDHLITIVSAAIESGVDKNIGAIMKYMKATYDGQYDGKVLSLVAKDFV